LGGYFARRVWHRMCGFNDFNCPALYIVTVARDHQSGQRAWPVIFNRARHRR
jgi:hypothetical protein